jgi:hypothetical protein
MRYTERRYKAIYWTLRITGTIPILIWWLILEPLWEGMKEAGYQYKDIWTDLFKGRIRI